VNLDALRLMRAHRGSWNPALLFTIDCGYTSAEAKAIPRGSS